MAYANGSDLRHHHFLSVSALETYSDLARPDDRVGGLSVSDFSFAIGLQAVIWGLTTPITASLAERYGFARMIALGGVLYATGLILMSLVQIPIKMNLTAGLMLGLGLSATGFPIILAAITKRVDAKRRSLFLGTAAPPGHPPAGAGADWPVFYQRIRLGSHRDNLRLPCRADRTPGISHEGSEAGSSRAKRRTRQNDRSR